MSSAQQADFIRAEVNAVHDHCDERMVPRVAPDGSLYSMAQRVALMSRAYRDCQLALIKPPVGMKAQ